MFLRVTGQCIVIIRTLQVFCLMHVLHRPLRRFGTCFVAFSNEQLKAYKQAVFTEQGFQLAPEAEGCSLFVMTRRNEEVIREGKEKELLMISFCMTLTNQI